MENNKPCSYCGKSDGSHDSAYPHPRLTQPEATAPATQKCQCGASKSACEHYVREGDCTATQDLSAAIPDAGKIVDYIYDRCGFVHRDMLVADVARMLAALASSANALGAGDRVDALDKISMIVDRDTPPDSCNEVVDHDIRGTPITRAMVERAGTWKRVRKPGQVSVGDKLRFAIGGKQKIKTAMKILHAGTDKEEVIYSTHKNFYFITSMVVDGTSTHKNVEFRAAILQSQKGAGHA